MHKKYVSFDEMQPISKITAVFSIYQSIYLQEASKQAGPV